MSLRGAGACLVLAVVLAACEGSIGDGDDAVAVEVLTTVVGSVVAGLPPGEDPDARPVVYVLGVGEDGIAAAVQADVAETLVDDVAYASPTSGARRSTAGIRPNRSTMAACSSPSGTSRTRAATSTSSSRSIATPTISGASSTPSPVRRPSGMSRRPHSARSTEVAAPSPSAAHHGDGLGEGDRIERVAAQCCMAQPSGLVRAGQRRVVPAQSHQIGDSGELDCGDRHVGLTVDGAQQPESSAGDGHGVAPVVPPEATELANVDQEEHGSGDHRHGDDGHAQPDRDRDRRGGHRPADPAELEPCLEPGECGARR